MVHFYSLIYICRNVASMLYTALCWSHSCGKMLSHKCKLLSDRSFRLLVLNREITSMRRHLGSFLGETLVVLMMTRFNRKPIL